MRWKDPTPIPSIPALHDLHPLVAQTLWRRGFTTSETIQAFLDPEKYTPAPAADLPGMVEAVQRLERAIRFGEPICIWGDFDVDGQTSTTVLFDTLTALGGKVTFHIPVRESEGHGVNLPHLKEIIDQGVKLIVTCDTGITADEAVDYARMQHVDMIITDHHDLPESIPKAAAVVDPKLLPQDHPLASLSGVGVAFKLAEGLIARFPSTTFSSASLLDLVAIGLVADLAILRGDTRYLVQKGLAALRTTNRLGLQVMLEMAELKPENLTEEHIGFILGPQLNALGRLGDANPAVELLTTTNAGRARLLATQLENYNVQRQLLCSQVTQAAEAQLRADPSLLEKPVIVLGHATWPGGVVGIVASRLVERYHKPAILFSLPENKPAHGSARSVEGLNITAAIAAQKDLLLNFGGHPMAAGLALEKEKLPEFYRRLSQTVENFIGSASREEPELRIDAWLEMSAITLELAEALECISPFGPGNDKLILATHNLSLQSVAKIGKNKEHLRFVVLDETGTSHKVLWWNRTEETLPETKFDLAFTLRASDWRGEHHAQMEFVDYRIIEMLPSEIPAQKREIVDYRNIENPSKLLRDFHNQRSTIIWAEAEAKKEVGGKDRNELESADTLVIWSIPPSSEEFQEAVKIVNPCTITLVCAHPFMEITDAFIARLTGLLKYTITHRNGNITYAQLAAATAQCLATVKVGLNWLVSRGNIVLLYENGNDLHIDVGKTINDPGDAARLRVEIQALLAETAAYRAHFKRADKDTLLS